MADFSVQSGGKTVFGAAVGILMLETRFPRILGDIGHVGTWPFPVHYRVVRGATPANVVLDDPRRRLPDFIGAAQDLVSMGCDGITTNCGFLSLLQDELRNAVGVPVATSSLMQVPMIERTLPAGQQVGILTISKATLSDVHLAAVGVPLDTPVEGTRSDGEFATKILGDQRTIDFAQCRLELLAAADTLCSEHQGIGAIVLECTNMVPYAADIRRQTGLPVFSIYTLIHWFQQGLLPQRFAGDIDDVRPDR